MTGIVQELFDIVERKRKGGCTVTKLVVVWALNELLDGEGDPRSPDGSMIPKSLESQLEALGGQLN